MAFFRGVSLARFSRVDSVGYCSRVILREERVVLMEPVARVARAVEYVAREGRVRLDDVAGEPGRTQVECSVCSIPSGNSIGSCSMIAAPTRSAHILLGRGRCSRGDFLPTGASTCRGASEYVRRDCVYSGASRSPSTGRGQNGQPRPSPFRVNSAPGTHELVRSRQGLSVSAIR